MVDDGQADEFGGVTGELLEYGPGQADQVVAREMFQAQGDQLEAQHVVAERAVLAYVAGVAELGEQPVSRAARYAERVGDLVQLQAFLDAWRGLRGCRGRARAQEP
ncbi:hypothetical protein ACR6C2_29465 [Streptomyces sp. INA 01156]